MADAVEKGLRTSPNSDSADSEGRGLGDGDDGLDQLSLCEACPTGVKKRRTQNEQI